jgi:hypothetical protein
MEAGVDIPTVSYAFSGSISGDPRADKVLRALKRAPNGLTRKQIRHGVFRKNTPIIEIVQVLNYLFKSNLATKSTRKTGGKPAEVWRATTLSQSL